MKHLTKVGRSSKLIQRKFVRVGEGTLIYNIGRNRFIEMARAAGAVYKVGDSKETLNYHHVDDISIILKRTRGDFAPLPFVILFE